MASSRLCKGIMDSSGSTIFTAAADTIVKAITICNYSSMTTWFTMAIAGTNIIYHHNILAYDTITVPFIDQLILNGETISAQSGAATSLTYYISGKTV